MRHLADHDVISRAAYYHTLNNRLLCRQMPLHVILSCNNTRVKEVSELMHSKHPVIHERQFVIPKRPYISTTKILDLFHTSLAQFTQSSNLLLHREHVYCSPFLFNPYPTAFPYGNGMVLHFYQQQESSTTKTVHKVINKVLKTYV